MNLLIFIFVVFVVSVGAYIFLKAQGNWKKALIELVRVLTVIFGGIAGFGEFFWWAISCYSKWVKTF